MTRRLLALSAALLVLASVACSDDEPSATPTTTHPVGVTTAPPTTSPPSPDVTLITAAYENGTVRIDDDRVEVARGASVRIEVTSDVAEEIHVHTYDQRADIAPGGTGVVEFVANIPGVIEVELEKSGERVVSLVVSG